MRGALAIVTNVRRDVVDAGSRLTSVAFAYGEIVWVRRPDAGVKFEGGQRCPRAMVSRKAGSPGRSRISRKAIAWGRPACCQLNLYARGQHIFLCNTPARPRVQRAPGLPHALYVLRVDEMQNFGQMMPRECKVVHFVARMSEATSGEPRPSPRMSLRSSGLQALQAPALSCGDKPLTPPPPRD